MYERGLRGREKALGTDHTSTLSTAHNLSLLYAHCGRLAEAVLPDEFVDLEKEKRVKLVPTGSGWEGVRLIAEEEV